MNGLKYDFYSKKINPIQCLAYKKLNKLGLEHLYIFFAKIYYYK